MYVIRDKNAKSILHISDADHAKSLSPKEVYEEFDSNTMEMGKTKASEVPDYFDIDESGEIVPLSEEEFKALKERGFTAVVPPMVEPGGNEATE